MKSLGISHEGRQELSVGGESTSIFAGSGQFDSYDHFSSGPFISIRYAQGARMICRIGGTACTPLDDRTSKLT